MEPRPRPRPCARCCAAAICTCAWTSDESVLDPGALDRPVRWVHSSDLADPTPFLSEGLVLLTTGTQFLDAGEDPEAFAAYVHRLAARGVVGLGFGTEVVRDGIPPALADACRDERMPLFEVPYRTPFIAVARANAEAIAAQAYARRSWALAAQRAIALAALRPDGLGATLAELSRQLDTWVGLFDAAGALSREHPARALGDGLLDELTGEVGAVLRRGARAGSSLRIERHAVHDADARPRRPPARRHRDRGRRPRPGGPRRRDVGRRDGRPRPRAAPESGARPRRAARGPRAVAPHRRPHARAADLPRSVGRVPGRAGARGGDGCRDRALRGRGRVARAPASETQGRRVLRTSRGRTGRRRVTTTTVFDASSRRASRRGSGSRSPCRTTSSPTRTPRR